MPATVLFADGLIVTGGCQRSGTSLVHRLISGHDSVQGVFTDWAVFDRLEYFQRWTGLPRLDSADDMRVAVEKLLKHDYVRKWGLQLDDVSGILNAFEPTWDSLFLSLVTALKLKHRKQRVSLKHPGGEEYFAHLKQLFDKRGEQVRFVYSVRSPFDTYLSFKHRAYAWVNDGRTEETPTQWSASWLESTAELLEFQYRFPDSIRIVRYEDVVSHPLEVAASLCDFLGLEDQSAAMVRLQDFEPNSSFQVNDLKQTVGGVVDTIHRPKATLSEREIDTLRAACGRRAKVFGYYLGDSLETPNVKNVRHEVALEAIPSAELLRCASRVISRRMWARLFSRTSVCKAP